MDLPSDAEDVLAQPTRARLFALLQSMRRSATTAELAKGVDLHVNGVRRQLEQLRESGLVERQQLSHGRGRPRDAWSVATDARPGGERPRAYTDLSRWLARATPASPGRLRQVEKTGREIGRELAPDPTSDLGESLQEVLTALGFSPALESGAEGEIACRLCNCPYRASVRENPAVVCALHEGMTRGLLEVLAPQARLTGFEPRDPDRAGCRVTITERARAEQPR
jgi:predicted ArsR family transcriptional regulator